MGADSLLERRDQDGGAPIGKKYIGRVEPLCSLPEIAVGGIGISDYDIGTEGRFHSVNILGIGNTLAVGLDIIAGNDLIEFSVAGQNGVDQEVEADLLCPPFNILADSVFWVAEDPLLVSHHSFQMEFADGFFRCDTREKYFASAGPAQRVMGNDIADPDAYVAFHRFSVNRNGDAVRRGSQIQKIFLSGEGGLVYRIGATDRRTQFSNDLLLRHSAVTAQSEDEVDAFRVGSQSLQIWQQDREDARYRRRAGDIITEDTDVGVRSDEIVQIGSDGVGKGVGDEYVRIGGWGGWLGLQDTGLCTIRHLKGECLTAIVDPCLHKKTSSCRDV